MNKPEEKTDEQITAGNLHVLTPIIKKHLTSIGGNSVFNHREWAKEIDKLGYKLVKKK